jgi:hypothetical protein
MSQETEMQLEIIRRKNQYETARLALNRWRSEKSHLHFGACQYSIKLISQMIEALHSLEILGLNIDHDVLEELERLLDDLPPDNDPPQAGPFLAYRSFLWVY